MYRVSGLAEEKALNGGINLLMQWPEDVFGVYGKNDATDEQIDAWVIENLIIPQTVRVAGIVPGRHHRGGKLIPCIQVTLIPATSISAWPAPRAHKWVEKESTV